MICATMLLIAWTAAVQSGWCFHDMLHLPLNRTLFDSLRATSHSRCDEVALSHLTTAMQATAHSNGSHQRSTFTTLATIASNANVSAESE
eukprot:2353604-Amphidinium_carterae.2